MISPEVRLARRLVERLDLIPPIDIKSLVQNYADVVFGNIPNESVDGICLNLKVPGRTPRVIVNSTNPSSRQRFTLAHELGHILIPWHLGSIIDNVDLTDVSASTNYWEMEREANSFAAEVLMPHLWLDKLLDEESDLALAHKKILKECNVSGLAAAIRIASYLEPGVVYAAVKNSVIQYSGKSDGTIAPTLPWGHEYQPNSYHYATDHYKVSHGEVRLNWWVLPASVELDESDVRNWREILDHILAEICASPAEAAKLRQSINGVAAYANSVTKRSSKYTPDAIVSACLQRFNDREEYKKFVTHPEFEAYVQKRSESFFD